MVIEKMNMWKIYKQMDRWTTDNRKPHLSFQFGLAKTLYN